MKENKIDVIIILQFYAFCVKNTVKDEDSYAF
jgi:hypothetical protein